MTILLQLIRFCLFHSIFVKILTMNLYVKSFVYGFLSIFGLVDSPIPGEIQRIFRRDDETALANDWMQVGKDIMNAYETTEKPSI